MSNVTLMAIDIAKNVFQLHGVDDRGNAIIRKRLSRGQLSEYMANLSCCTVVMEACGGANYWARDFQAMGHEVKLISPQFVKPFVKSNKNDRNDARAIAEAASRPDMRFVCIKAIEQQDIQSLHRIREGYINQRTRLMNQIRGLLAEYGLVVKPGEAALRRALPEFIEDADNELTAISRHFCQEIYEDIIALSEKVAQYEKEIKKIFRSNHLCQRIEKIPGIGPITATALIADLRTPHHFKNGRQFAAYLGLVPKQHSSGGRNCLLGISKRGDSYLRKLLIHGARSVVRTLGNKEDKLSCHLKDLQVRRGFNRTSVALANRNARVIWALLAHDQEYNAAM